MACRRRCRGLTALGSGSRLERYEKKHQRKEKRRRRDNIPLSVLCFTSLNLFCIGWIRFETRQDKKRQDKINKAGTQAESLTMDNIQSVLLCRCYFACLFPCFLPSLLACLFRCTLLQCETDGSGIMMRYTIEADPIGGGAACAHEDGYAAKRPCGGS